MCIIIYNKIILHSEKYVTFFIFFIFYINFKSRGIQI